MNADLSQLLGQPAAQLSLQPQGSAVLIIDVQNDMCSANGIYAQNGLECPSISPMLKPLRNFLEACRKLKVTLINVRTEYACDEEGRPIHAALHLENRPFLKEGGLRPDTWGAQTVEHLPTPDHEIVKDFSFSSFFRTDLEPLLRQLRIKTLVLTGIYTNYCVQSTAMDAYQRNFRVAVIHDLVTAWDKDVELGSLKTLSGFAHVIKSSEALHLLENEGRNSR